MEYRDISAGELASVLEVQRSNISHVLNGRNMPGAAFIEKLLVNFPDLNARWLITGEGEMVSDEGTPRVKEVEKQEEKQSNNAFIEKTKQSVTAEKKIIKIVLLFSDGTFVDYVQE